MAERTTKVYDPATWKLMSWFASVCTKVSTIEHSDMLPSRTSEQPLFLHFFAYFSFRRIISHAATQEQENARSSFNADTSSA